MDGKISLRPFLTQSDFASQNGAFRRDFFAAGLVWSFFLSSVVVHCIVFVLFLEAVGVRE